MKLVTEKWFSFSKKDLIAQMTEKRPLPLGRKDFDAWAARIISGAMIDADKVGQKFALADMILHLGPTEDHKEDAYFIKMLRKVCVNQVADSVRREIKDKFDAEARAIEAKKLAEKLPEVPN